MPRVDARRRALRADPRARSPRRSTRRRAAISIRAARRPSTAAASRRPPLREIAPGTHSACHLNDHPRMKPHPAFTRQRPHAAAVVPLVLDSPHSGTEYPDDFRPALPLEALRQAEDSYVDELYGDAPAHRRDADRGALPARYIDPNRSLLDIDARCSTRPGPGPRSAGRKTQLGIGLIWRVLDTRRADLRAQALDRRSEAPHRALPPALPDARCRTRSTRPTSTSARVWHLNLHSMPAVSSRVSEEGPGKPRADFVLGDRDGTHLRARVHRAGGRDAARHGLRREGERPVQGRRAGARLLRSRRRSATACRSR